MLSSYCLLAAASVASAHFSIAYPSWRADSLSNTSYSQYTFPCAGVPQGVPGDNRTDWPATGGSLELDLHHPWSYIFINVGLGDNVTNYNYTLTPQFWNETGSGTLCIPHLDLPADLAPGDGQHATIQVVTLGESGSALYNCADITFRTNATIAEYGGANCTTSAGVSFSIISEQTNGSDSTGTGTGTSSGAAATATSAGTVGSINMPVLSSVVAAAIVFMYGMSA